jgi:hypothetical protein
MKRYLIAAAVSLCTTITLTLTGCAGAGSFGSGDGQTVTIAMVSNPQMQDAIKLSDQFEAQNPGIHLKFVTLPENEGPRQNHHVDGHRRSRVRRRHDQQLRNAAVGAQRVAHRPLERVLLRGEPDRRSRRRCRCSWSDSSAVRACTGPSCGRRRQWPHCRLFWPAGSRSCRRSRSSLIGPSCGSACCARVSNACASCTSVAPGRSTVLRAA